MNYKLIPCKNLNPWNELGLVLLTGIFLLLSKILALTLLYYSLSLYTLIMIASSFFAWEMSLKPLLKRLDLI